MSDPQIPLPSPVSAPELVKRLVRWLALAALVLAVLFLVLPLGLIMAPLGLLLIIVVALLATGNAPPSWLACIDPKNVGSVGGAMWPLLIAIVVVLALFLLGLPGLLIVFVIVAVMFALGWSGIGPLAPFAAIVRGLIQLIRLLPSLRLPVGLAAEALTKASEAMGTLRDGLETAQDQVGRVRSAIASIGVPNIKIEPDKHRIGLPAGGSIDVPGLKVSQTTETPFSGSVAERLDDVQKGLIEARKAAETQRDRLKEAGAALKGLHDLLPPGT